MLQQQHPLLLAAFGMDMEMIKQEIEKAAALEKLKVWWIYTLYLQEHKSIVICMYICVGSY